MTSLRVICGLGPPNQKSWLRLWVLKQLMSVNGLKPKVWLVPVAAREHFERVSCKLYINIWALKSQFRR